MSANFSRLRAALANANIVGKVTINTVVRLNATRKRDNASQNKGLFTNISPKQGNDNFLFLDNISNNKRYCRVF
ncbi:hypothetical protein CYANOKiyG1_50530 [Okeania sp. KiyG1]|nr:hypothetical protein CYANOKiyG1_50530 [Okeania sp. KiyG1]